MRGLKPDMLTDVTSPDGVASFTDAWIETFDLESVEHHDTVASFTDAWIETFGKGYKQQYQTSHLLQMRGLKP